MKPPKTTFFFLLITLMCLPVLAQDRSTETISRQYLKFDAELDYESLAGLMADDMVFSDPTGDVFNGPVSKGPVHGAEAILRMMKGWDLGSVQFEPDHSFFAGEYAVHRGTYRVQYASAPGWYAIPFVTIHRVRNGKVIERTDFGEYISSFGLGNGFDANTKSTSRIGKAYLQAYLDIDFEQQEKLMASTVSFQDPTAQMFGPQSGKLFETEDALLSQRRRVFATISDFDFTIEAEFAANHHAVFMGKVTYKTGNGRTYVQPAVFVIEVRDGEVTRHWDYVDYTVGPLGS